MLSEAETRAEAEAVITAATALLDVGSDLRGFA
jgi:hypothetical protein